LSIIEKALNTWPVDKIFPWVDLLRVLAAREDGRQLIEQKPVFHLKFVVMIKTKVALGTSLSILIMRYFSNLVARTDKNEEAWSASSKKVISHIIDLAAIVLTHDTQKAAKLAASVVLLKYVGVFGRVIAGLITNRFLEQFHLQLGCEYFQQIWVSTRGIFVPSDSHRSQRK
jgi:hypothetical protein